MKDGKLPAFPQENGIDSGLTKREYFTAFAMQGLIISQGEKNLVNDWGVHGERISENAVHIADSIINELAKTENKYDSLKEIVKQIEMGDYESEGGYLKNNIAFVALKKMSE